MKFFYLVILLVGVFFACKDTGDRRKGKDRYHESLLFFGDSLVKHFPRKFEYGGYETTIAGSTDTIKFFFKIHRMYLYQKYSDQEYSKIHSFVDSLSKVIYDSKDSTLLLLFNYQDKVEANGRVFGNVASPLEKRMACRNKHTGKSLPVPLFGDKYNTDAMYTGATYSGLRNGFKLHVLDAVPGLFLPGNKLSNSSACLPEKWEHGYSRGVALNDRTKEAVYWIVVW